MNIDRDRAASLGVTPAQIETALGAAYGGQQVSSIYASSDQYQVILELLPQYQQDAAALTRLYVTSNGGTLVPLSAVAHIGQGTMPLSINHLGQIPSVTHLVQPGAGKGAERRGDRDQQAVDKSRHAGDGVRPASRAPRRRSRARPRTWACCC